MTAATDSTRTPSLKERQRHEREQLILSAAGELLLERGYHDTSIDDIAARVGISKGTVYLHFAGKEELVLALIERNMRQFSAALDEILSAPGSPRAKLEATLRRIYGDMPNRHSQLRATIFQDPALMGRMAERRCAFTSIWHQWMRRVAQVFDEGKASGDFDPTLPTPVLVTLFGNLLSPHGYHSLVVEEGMTIDEVLTHVTQFFFRGIAPTPLAMSTTDSSRVAAAKPCAPPAMPLDYPSTTEIGDSAQ
jgi:TetR/AcrR family fatty acid metabolism transcriptional regulator